MAEPISLGNALEVGESERRNRALEELLEQLADHEQGLKKMLDVVELLEQKGAFSATIAVLEQGNDILQILFEQLNKPEQVRAFQNIVVVLQALSAMETAPLQNLAKGFADGLTDVNSGERVQVTSIFDLLKLLRDADVARAVSFIATMLKAIGRSLADKSGGHDEGVYHRDPVD